MWIRSTWSADIPMIEDGSGSPGRGVASRNEQASSTRPQHFPAGRNDAVPEERTLARATQDATFIREHSMHDPRHGPPPVIAPAPPSPCPNPRTVPSIAVTCSPSSNALPGSLPSPYLFRRRPPPENRQETASGLPEDQRAWGRAQRPQKRSRRRSGLTALDSWHLGMAARSGPVHACSSSSRPDQAGRDIQIEVRHLPGGELRQRDARHRGVVGAECQRGDEQLDPLRGGHRRDALAEP